MLLRIGVEQGAAIFANESGRHSLQCLVIGVRSKPCPRAAKLNHEELRVHFIDLLARPFFAARDVAREMIGCCAKTASARRNVSPEVSMNGSADFREPRQCLDV